MHGVVKPGFFGGIFKGWQKPHRGEKGFKNWTYGKVVRFVLTKTHIFFLREKFPEKGTSCMGIFFFKWQIK